MSLVFKDAFWQISWRVVSAFAWFFVVKLITPYLGPLRYWDYSTILKYFAIWSALADFWIYVVALNSIWKIQDFTEKLQAYHKFLWFRFFMVIFIYLLAFLLAFFIPAYVQNPYIFYGLAIWMFFSATFMIAGIVQLPLQLSWQMKHVSIALILARCVQISLLIFIIFYLFPNVDFTILNKSSLIAFLLILSTVFFSWFTQYLYVHRKGSKYMKFRIDFDKKFIKNMLKTNWKYWLSYYLSSFHTLIVLIFLSIIFPTKDGFTYVWIWTLALALLEILLIVPSAFWNSIIHKIAFYKEEDKLKSLGYFLTFIMWFWFLVLFNFIVFKTHIIDLIAWKAYLTTANKIWSDFVLPFLAFVLFLSFIKQVFNYVLVSFNKHNKLLKVNLIWVIIWVILWLYLIPKYNIYGGLITQIIIELCFVFWIIIIAYNNKIIPKINISYIFYSLLIFLWFMMLYFVPIPSWKIWFVFYAFFVNILYILVSYKFIKKIIDKI